MTSNKQHLCKEILTEVKNQMFSLSQSKGAENGRPDYSWLSQIPRITMNQREKLEELTSKLGETECKTAVIALRTELGPNTIISANDVPTLMCQILKQLIEDRKTMNLFSAGTERRQSLVQHQRPIQKEFPQDTINTITEHVKGPSTYHPTRWRQKIYLPKEEPGLYTLTVHSSSTTIGPRIHPAFQDKKLQE